MESDDYLQLTGAALRLLLALVYQFRGRNNGNLSAAPAVMQKHGFNSRDTLQRAKQQLLDANLIVETRPGRFTNPGGICALYALTWLPVDECKGKDLIVKPTTKPLRNFWEEARGKRNANK